MGKIAWALIAAGILLCLTYFFVDLVLDLIFGGVIHFSFLILLFTIAVSVLILSMAAEHADKLPVLSDEEKDILKGLGKFALRTVGCILLAAWVLLLLIGWRNEGSHPSGDATAQPSRQTADESICDSKDKSVWLDPKDDGFVIDKGAHCHIDYELRNGNTICLQRHNSSDILGPFGEQHHVDVMNVEKVFSCNKPFWLNYRKTSKVDAFSDIRVH